MAIRGILLDKDGTLIDFDGTWGPAAYEVMRALSDGDAAKFDALAKVSHYRVAERRFLPSSPLIAGSSASYGPLWAQALGRAPDEALYTEMDDLFRFWGLESLAPIGTPALLVADLVAAGYHVGIATNDAEASARAQAEALGLTPFLEYIAGYDSGYGGKPDPGMVLGFARHHGLEPGEVAMIGDSTHDLVSARAAGSVAVAVLTGPMGEGARAEIAPHADHVIGTLADLPALLAHIGAAPARTGGAA
jgi:phosphoglycolate phosphatase